MHRLIAWFLKTVFSLALILYAIRIMVLNT